MQTDSLPVISYATPFEHDPTAVWREENFVIARRGAILPPICVKCGGPSSRYFRLEYYWHHPAWYLLLLFPWLGILFYALVHRAYSDHTILVRVPLCSVHSSQRFWRAIAAWAGAAVVCALTIVIVLSDPFDTHSGMFGGSMDGSRLTIAMTGLLFLFLTLYFERSNRLIIRPRSMDLLQVRLKGASPDFLAVLPFVAPDESIPPSQP